MSLNLGVERSITVSKRQVLGCGKQIEVWTGKSIDQSFFAQFLRSYDVHGVSSTAGLREDLERASRFATAICGIFS